MGREMGGRAHQGAVHLGHRHEGGDVVDVDAANPPSITRRLSRFLDNPAVRVREWYEPIATGLVQSMANTAGEIRLIADQLARPLEEGRKRTFWLCPVYDRKLRSLLGEQTGTLQAIFHSPMRQSIRSVFHHGVSKIQSRRMLVLLTIAENSRADLPQNIRKRLGILPVPISPNRIRTGRKSL